MRSFYLIYSSLLAFLVFVGAIAAVIVLSRREADFWRATYPKWIWFTCLLSFIAPPFLQPPNISLVDTYLLRERFAGWGDVLIVYSMFMGVLMGGFAALLIRAKQ